MKHFEVVAAIIEYNGKFLCMQRNKGKYDYVSLKFEFPGGKVEANETNAEALMRELYEEMNIKVHITENDYFMSIHHAYPDFEITMHTYKCCPDTDYFVRKEHISHKWLKKDELQTLDWAPADLPIVKRIMEE